MKGHQPCRLLSMAKGEADRVAAERARAARDSQAAATQASRNAVWSKLNDLVDRAEIAIPEALEALARAGHPDIEEVNVYVPGRRKRSKLQTLGAYKTPVTFEVNEHVYRNVYLVSNGRIMIGSGSESPQTYAERVAEVVGVDGTVRRSYSDCYTIEGFEKIVKWIESKRLPMTDFWERHR
jgi:hypothetical protein